MKKLKKQINETVVELKMTIEEALALKELLEKDELMEGRPKEDGCECPRCGTKLIKGGYRCPCCGQRVKYNESDIIPL